MGLKERKDTERKIIMQKIFDATTDIIVNEGYEKLSLRKIAKKIEYSPTVVYNYYKSKDTIVRDIIESVYLKILENVKSELIKNAHLSFENKFKLMTRTFIKTMISEPEKVRAARMGGFNIFSKEVPDNEGVVMLRDFLNEGFVSGVFAKQDDDVAKLIITALLGFVYLIVDDKTVHDFNIDSLIEIYSNIILSGILSK